MMIGIHQTKGSFSDRWIEYCKANNIPWKPVDCYRSDIIYQLADCDAMMWHFSHMNSKDIKFSRQLHYSIQASGKTVFPDFHTMWHFDDKVGQKYLLEAIGAPLVPSFVFYSKEAALDWAEKTIFPKVFKLRGGAGSANVRLVHTKKNAIKLINKAFSIGFGQNDACGGLKERWRKYKLGKTNIFDIVKGIIRFIYPTDFARMAGREKGYVYFQDFIANNEFDIRVIVIDNKAFAIKRIVRQNDFRASGSGNILYEKDHFDKKTIGLSFDLAEKLKSQSAAFDFVYLDGKPLVVEVSYGFAQEGYNACPGYWTKDLEWHEGHFDPCSWMVDSVIKSIALKNG